MAMLVGNQFNTGNFGEDYLCGKLCEFFKEDFVVYRNREVFGCEFDVAMLMPEIGIVIFEAKGWAESTIIRIEGGDTIVINTDEGEAKAAPQKQVRGYRFALERRIRQSIGKFPLVFTMVALPQITERFYFSNNLNVVIEEPFVLLKEDFASVEKFYAKVNNAISHVKNWNRASFDSQLMNEVRGLFEADSEICANVPGHGLSLEAIYRADETGEKYYSLFCYIKSDMPDTGLLIENIARSYASGCKIVAVVDTEKVLRGIVSRIDGVLDSKGLVRSGNDLVVNYSEKGNHYPNVKDCTTSFSGFNISASVLGENNECREIPGFLIVDGALDDKKGWLEKLSSYSMFNLEQYLVEHTSPDKNIIIRAGAGTGKTHTMISRVDYICRKQNIPVLSLAERILMITFTNEAAEQMKKRLRANFQNYYLLTSERDYLEMTVKVNQMQISTIHAYVKKLVSIFGTEFGYGVDVDITSTQFFRRQKVSKMVDAFISQKRKEQGEIYLSKLGLPVYAIVNNIVEFIKNLNNKSFDITSCGPVNFGELAAGSRGQELHELLSHIIPQVEKEYAEELRTQNKVHLNSMITLLNGYLHEPKIKERIEYMKESIPMYMFVDEFQDTDDTQIEMLMAVAGLFGYNMFLVGDTKQCIYRFRGAEEHSFERLHTEKNPALWEEFSLQRNYRTDVQLLELYDKSFKGWGQEGLLSYDKTRDKLLGSKKLNHGLQEGKYYKQITVNDEKQRLTALFEEVARLKRRIAYDIEKGKELSDTEKCIAILVRENWQAELIRKEGARIGLSIHTNTGGDLYQSAPALDMMTLVNALLYFDEADYLYEFATSSFFTLSMPKSSLFTLRKKIRDNGWRAKVDEKEQTDFLIEAMNTLFSRSRSNEYKSWEAIIKSLRTNPILQVMREVYSTLKPWRNFSNELWKQQYYKLNVDLLFEQILSVCNSDRLTVNTLADYLFASIASGASVDSRSPSSDYDVLPIQCITVHKAKGLEYGHVVLPYASSSIRAMKPGLYVSLSYEKGVSQIGYSISCGENNDRIQNNHYSIVSEESERIREETRVLYVAMTRAIRSFSWISLRNNNKQSWQSLIQRGGYVNAL